MANSDSHNSGDPNSTVGSVKNGVYVRRKLTERSFYRALEAGRSFATTGPSLDIKVNGRLMGGEAKIDDDRARIKFSVNSESDSAIIVKIDVIKNGEVWQTYTPNTPVYETKLVDTSAPEKGYYRIEVTAYDLASGQYSFAWSNPVFVVAD